MKLRRTILSMSAIIATGAIATSVVTSCSGVSQSIIDNLVGRGDGTMFGKNSDGTTETWSLEQAIHSALTDKNSIASFKKAVVNDALYIWYDNRANGKNGVTKNQSYKNQWDQWNKSISDDYDGKIQNYKNQHNSNWPYYFQNEILDPVGGTKDAYFYSQMCDKVRSAFTAEVWKTTLLGLATTGTDFSSGVIRNYDVSPSNNYGMGSGNTGDLKSTRWNDIDFSPYVDAKYTGNDDTNKTYENFFSTLQKTAFEMYFDRAHPVASSMCIWTYKAPTGGLVKVYNGDIIPNQNTSSSNGTVGDGKPLDSPSYAFPYFDVSHDPTTNGPNESFQAFANGFNSTNNYYNGTDATTGLFGLTNISTDLTDDPGVSCVYNLPQWDALNSSYETFAPEVLNLYHNIKATEPAEVMPVNIINPTSYATTASPDIMKNFLFTGKDGENPLPATINVDTTGAGSAELGNWTNTQKAYYGNITYGKHNASGNDVSPVWVGGPNGTGDYGKLVSPNTAGELLPNSVIDLSTIFENDKGEHQTDTQFKNRNHDHIKIFNTESDWYRKGYRYLVSGVRLHKDTTGTTPVTKDANTLPAYLIRNASGVHFEGVYGQGFINSGATGATDNDKKLNAEKALYKYRALYEKNATTAPMGKGLNIIDADSQSNDSAKAFFTANTDDVILEAMKRYSDGTTTINPITTPWNEIFKDTKFTKNKFDKLYDFAKATYQYFWMQEIMTNYDSANKKLFGWGSTYAANDMYVKSDIDDPVNVDTIYNNGLGQALPYVPTSGDALSTSSVFSSTAKTFYKVVRDNMIADFTSSSTTDYKTPLTSATDLNLMLTTGDTDHLGINTTFSAWKDYLQANNEQVAPFLPGSYSEHILTNNNYVNSMLQTFAGGSTFSNNIKTGAYDYYLNNSYSSDPNKDIYKDTTKVKLPIVSQYLTEQMLKDNKLSYYMNAGAGNAAIGFSNFTDGIYNQWNYQNSLDASFSGITNGDTTNLETYSHGTSDKKVSYLNLLASIKYLSINNYAQFFRSLQLALGVSDANQYDNPAYIAWVSTDNTAQNSSFGAATDNVTANIQKIYGWKNNYFNTMENIYSNTNIPTANNGNKTYVENKQYYNFAAMPTTSNGTGAHTIPDGMGFAGIVTKNSHGTLPDAAGTALFTRPKDTTSKVNQQGILHRYGFNIAYSTDPSKDSFEKWYCEPYTDTSGSVHLNGHIGDMSSDDIDKMATDLDSSIIGFGATLGVVKDAKTKADKVTALIGTGNTPGGTGIKNLVKPGAGASDAVIGDDYFKAFNLSNSTVATSQATFELNNPDNENSAVIKDSAKSNQGTRVRAEQISYQDILAIQALSDPFSAFCNTFGTEVAYTLLVQFANQTDNLSNAEHDVITFVFGSGSGAIVYDRRLNDLLGSKWVKDWKSDN